MIRGQPEVIYKADTLSSSTSPLVMLSMLHVDRSIPSAGVVLFPDILPTSTTGHDTSFARQLSNIIRWPESVDESVHIAPSLLIARTDDALPLLAAAEGVCHTLAVPMAPAILLSDIGHLQRSDSLFDHACLIEPNSDDPAVITEAAGVLRKLGFGAVSVVRGDYYNFVEPADRITRHQTSDGPLWHHGTTTRDDFMNLVGRIGGEEVLRHDVLRARIVAKGF